MIFFVIRINDYINTTFRGEYDTSIKFVSGRLYDLRNIT